MSVILRRNNRIILYCKGADNVIYDRLNSNQLDIKTRTQEHLNVSSPYFLCETRINQIPISGLLEICWRRSANIGPCRTVYR